MGRGGVNKARPAGAVWRLAAGLPRVVGIGQVFAAEGQLLQM